MKLAITVATSFLFITQAVATVAGASSSAVVEVPSSCNFCADFDATLPIDMSQLDTMLMVNNGDDYDYDYAYEEEGGAGPVSRRKLLRKLQDDPNMDLTTCAQLPAVLVLMDNNADEYDTTCDTFRLISMMFCGCGSDGACNTCAFDGSSYPDPEAAPNYEVFKTFMGNEDDMMAQVDTCRELSTQMSVMVGFMNMFTDSITAEFRNEDEDVSFDLSTSSPSLVDSSQLGDGEMDLEKLMCGAVGMACGCPTTNAECPICEFGLKNPDDVVVIDDEDEDGDGDGTEEESLTCAQGLEQLRMMAAMGSCNDANDIFDQSNCICNEVAITTAPSESPSTTTTPDSTSGTGRSSSYLSFTITSMVLPAFFWLVCN